MEKGKAVGHILYEVVKIVQNKQSVMKLDGFGSPIGFINNAHGYDVFNLQDVNGKTRLIFQSFVEIETIQMSEPELQVAGDKNAEAGAKSWEQIFIPVLRALL